MNHWVNFILFPNKLTDGFLHRCRLLVFLIYRLRWMKFIQSHRLTRLVIDNSWSSTPRQRAAIEYAERAEEILQRNLKFMFVSLCRCLCLIASVSAYCFCLCLCLRLRRSFSRSRPCLAYISRQELLHHVTSSLIIMSQHAMSPTI